jgi:hypothetical protein
LSIEDSCLGTAGYALALPDVLSNCGASLSSRIRLSKGLTNSGQASGKSAPVAREQEMAGT